MFKSTLQKVLASTLIATMMLTGMGPATMEHAYAGVEVVHEMHMYCDGAVCESHDHCEDQTCEGYSQQKEVNDNYTGEGISVAVLDAGITEYDAVKSVSFVEDDTVDNSHGNDMASVLLEKAPGIELYDVRVLGDNGEGTYSAVSKGIYWAVENGADIIVMSFAGYEASATLADALNYAEEKGVLIVVAAGNDGNVEVTYPAAYPSVIAVGALTEEGTENTNFNCGEIVDIYVNVCGGTSAAAQYVAAMAAQLMQEHQDMTMEEAREFLAPGRDTAYENVSETEESVVYAMACSHVVGSSSWKVTRSATCASSGKKECRCTKCGTLLYTTTIPALGHSYGSWSTTKSATCTAAGSKKRTCTRQYCYAYETQSISALGHYSNGVTKVTKQPTCTSTGTRVHICARSGCGAQFSPSTIAKTAHNYVTTKVAASCTGAGSETTKCSVCGNVSSKKTIAALGHAYGSWTQTKAATCTAAGSKKRTCTRQYCYAYETQSISALGHYSNGVTKVTKQPTCTSTGTRVHICARSGCGAEFSPSTIAKTAHNYVTTKVAASCTGTGSETTKCSVCGDVSSQKTIGALGHAYGSWTETKAATCTTTGTQKRTCTRQYCYAYETRSTSALGHYSNGVTKVTKQPTCTSTGTRVHICARNGCGAEFSPSTIAKTAHNYVTTKVAASCMGTGSETTKCSVCGDVSSQKTIGALGHAYGSWTETKAATCTTTGTKKRTCTRQYCYAYETETIPALGHTSNGVTKITKEATCKEQGIRVMICSREKCGQEFLPTNIGYGSHAWGEWWPAANYEQSGLSTRTCSVCGEYETCKSDELEETPESGMGGVSFYAPLGGTLELTLVEDTSIFGTIYYDRITYYAGSELEEFFPDAWELIKGYIKDTGHSTVTGVIIGQAAKYAAKKMVEEGVKTAVAEFVCTKAAGPLLSIVISFDMFLVEQLDDIDLAEALDESDNGLMVITGHTYEMSNLGEEYPNLPLIRREYENYEPWNNFYVDVPSGYEYSWTPGLE